MAYIIMFHLLHTQSLNLDHPHLSIRSVCLHALSLLSMVIDDLLILLSLLFCYPYLRPSLYSRSILLPDGRSVRCLFMPWLWSTRTPCTENSLPMSSMQLLLRDPLRGMHREQSQKYSHKVYQGDHSLRFMK